MKSNSLPADPAGTPRASGRHQDFSPPTTILNPSRHTQTLSTRPQGRNSITGHPSTMAETRFESLPFQPQTWYPYYADTTTASYSRSVSETAGESNHEFEIIDNPLFSQRPQMSPMAPPQSPWHPSSVSSYSGSGFPSAVFPPSPYSSYTPWPETPASIETSHSMGAVSSPIPIYHPAEAMSSAMAGSYSTTSFSLPSAGLNSHPRTLSSPSPDIIAPGSCSPVSSTTGTPYARRHSVGPVRVEKRRPRASHSSSRETSRPGRSRPMSDDQKQKADLVRDLGACWRCRRYKKSCNGPGECTNCKRGNFRVWPCSLGCRRGTLEELVAHILPAPAADLLAPASRIAIRQPNWRLYGLDMEQRRMIEERLPVADKWERLSLKVQSTGMFGSEFAGLFDILVTYQEAQSRPNQLLEASVQLLDSSCDIYQHFVDSTWPLAPAELTAAIATAQRASVTVCKMFLTSALSGRRRDWLPSFLSTSMSFIAIMILLDMAVAVPAHARDSLWGNIDMVTRDLRNRLFPVITDLLRASSNGTKPFALGCWTVASAGAPSVVVDQDAVRNPEGMRMLGSDKAAFDGMRALQEWIRSNVDLVDPGAKMMRSEPFTTPEVPCIAAVLKLFDL